MTEETEREKDLGALEDYEAAPHEFTPELECHWAPSHTDVCEENADPGEHYCAGHLREMAKLAKPPAGTPEQDKGAQIALYVAGLTPEKDRVVIIVEVTGASPFRAKFLYDQKDVSVFCMDLVKAGQAIEAAKPKGRIVLPPNGNTRLPRSLRRP